MRTCTKCQQTFPETTDHFHYQRTRLRFNSICKKCWSAKTKAWAQSNREKSRAYTRKYKEANRDEVRRRDAELHRASRKANPERVRATTNRRRAANPEAARTKQRAYYTANREKINKATREYRQRHLHKIREQATRRRKARLSIIRQQERDWYAKNAARVNARVRQWERANPQRVAYHHQKRRAKVAKSPVNDFTDSQWLAIQATFDHRCAYCNKRFKGRLTQDHVTPLSKGGAHTATNIVPACRSCNSKKHTGPPLRPVQRQLIV